MNQQRFAQQLRAATFLPLFGGLDGLAAMGLRGLPSGGGASFGGVDWT